MPRIKLLMFPTDSLHYISAISGWKLHPPRFPVKHLGAILRPTSFSHTTHSQGLYVQRVSGEQPLLRASTPLSHRHHSPASSHQLLNQNPIPAQPLPHFSGQNDPVKT